MPWLILIASGVLEAVWATALGASDGASKPLPVLVFAVALGASMAGLALSLRRIPLGTAYAVWVGIGASLTVVYAMITGEESFSWPKSLFLSGIVVAVIGLKLAPEPAERGRSRRAAESSTHTASRPDAPDRER
ncbi:DMT family transporter [Dietzia sp.]|uniref:DMT family transporter n=1 Tax=Dietzia sp. TaxID=1871616 RepID=UPI002FD8FCC2